MNEPKTTTPDSTDSARPNKRRVRNILIHRPMQREYTFIVVLLLMVSSLFVTVIIHNTINEVALGGGFRFGKISPFEVLSDVRYQLMLRVTGVLFVTMITVAIFGIFFLHRIAGPMHRFRQILMKLNDGKECVPVSLREGDFFNEVKLEINRLIKRTQFEQNRAKRMREKIDQLANTQPQGPAGDIARELKSLIDQKPEF